MNGMTRITALRATAVLIILSLAVFPAQAAVDTKVNQIGRLTSVGNGQTRTFQQYDPEGRKVATHHVQDGLSRVFSTEYGYPQNPATTAGPGMVAVKEIFSDGEQVLYTHDAAGMVVTVRSVRTSGAEDVLRDSRSNARGQVTRTVLGNGTTTTRTYDDTGHLRLTRITTTNAAGQVLQDYGYTYDGRGNVTGTTDGVRPDQSFTLQYDPLGQLTAMLNPAGSVLERYVYDAVGNLTQKGSIVQTYGAGGRPHALASSGGIAYTYDANGNAITIGGNTTLEWDAENMSTKVTAGAVVTQKAFVAGTLWKKVEQGVTTYYLPSMRLENGVARKYYGRYAERFEQAGDSQLRFYHPDHLGSSSVMTDQSGTVIRRVSYFPWGNERGVDATFTPKLQFNFKEKDANGLYDYGARMYSPATGRWLSADPLLVDGLNRYAYVRNNPWTLLDPTGLSTILVVIGPRKPRETDTPTASIIVVDKEGNRVAVGTHGTDHIPALARGQHGTRTREDGDTPWGVYRKSRDSRSDLLPGVRGEKGERSGTQGGQADSNPRGRSYGTGLIYMEPVFGEALDATPDRVGLRIHGGGGSLGEHAFDPLQELQATQGCVKMHNQDVNALIGTMVQLDLDGDAVDYIFMGDAQYLEGLSQMRTDDGRAWRWPDLRLVLGHSLEPPPAPTPTPTPRR